MFVFVVEIAFILIASYFVFTTAREYGRNAIGWTVFTIVAGFGMLLISPIVIAIFLGLILGLSGIFNDRYALLSAITWGSFIGSLILTLGVIVFILKQVSKMLPDEKPFIKPPEPPKFD
jgi:hypothetical protein